MSSSQCRLLMKPYIIKNELNPTIMSYCDNQKCLIHFLPVPPSTHQLPDCIFPMSFESVSSKKGRGDHKGKSWCTLEHHQDHMFFLANRFFRHCCGCLCTLQQLHHKMENGVRGHGAMVWELHYHSRSSVHVSFSSYAYWHGSIHRTAFLQWYISAGGAGCALAGRPRGLLLCIRVHSLLKSSRWAPPSRVGNTSPRN